MMFMSKQNLVEIHKKLDALIETTHKTKTDVKLIEQHLKQLNGKVLAHEKLFDKTFAEFNDLKKHGDVRFVCVEDKINQNTKDLVFAKGSLFALTILSLVLGIFISIKSIGII